MNIEAIDDIPLFARDLGNEIPSYPDRILEYSGFLFGFGMFCGLFSHPIKAICNFPKNGLLNGLKGYPKATLINVPRLGAKFALFAGIWTTIQCGLDYCLDDEATSHHIIGFAATTALFKSRQGFSVASRSAIGWGSAIYLLGEAKFVMERIYSKRSANSIIKVGFDHVLQSKLEHLPDVISIWKLDEQKRAENFGGRMSFGGLSVPPVSAGKE